VDSRKVCQIQKTSLKIPTCTLLVPVSSCYVSCYCRKKSDTSRCHATCNRCPLGPNPSTYIKGIVSPYQMSQNVDKLKILLVNWLTNKCWMLGTTQIMISFYHGAAAPVGQGLLIINDSWSHSDTPHLVGFLWTSNQSKAETSTWQHTTLTRDKHPFPQPDSNPESQQGSGHRPMP